MDTLNDSQARVRRWRAAEIAEHTSTPRATTTRALIPAMVTAGVLARRGRYWYGRTVDIDAWLLGRWRAAEPTPTGDAPGGR